MVFFFESEGNYNSLFNICLDKEAIIYMGKDKFENEELIKYAFPHDVWYNILLLYFRFHVDNFSSAHVYLRMKKHITSYEEMPEKAIIECA